MQKFSLGMFFIILSSSCALKAMEAYTKSEQLEALKQSYNASPPERRKYCAQILFIREATNHIRRAADHQEVATVSRIEAQKRIREQKRLR